MAEAEDVGVYDDAFGDAVEAAEDDVGGFAGYSGKAEEFWHGFGDYAVEFRQEEARCALEGFGFVAVEAGGADGLFDSDDGRVGEGLRRGEEAEEFGRDEVDADVSALRGEDGGDGEFPGVAMGEGADYLGIGFVEAAEDFCYAGGRAEFFC